VVYGRSNKQQAAHQGPLNQSLCTFCCSSGIPKLWRNNKLAVGELGGARGITRSRLGGTLVHPLGACLIGLLRGGWVVSFLPSCCVLCTIGPACLQVVAAPVEELD